MISAWIYNVSLIKILYLKAFIIEQDLLNIPKLDLSFYGTPKER